jgi:hypothetical protein
LKMGIARMPHDRQTITPYDTFGRGHKSDKAQQP